MIILNNYFSSLREVFSLFLSTWIEKLLLRVLSLTVLAMAYNELLIKLGALLRAMGGVEIS